MQLTFRRIASVVVLGIALALAAHFSASGYLLMTKPGYLFTVGIGLMLVVLVLHQVAGNERSLGLSGAITAGFAAPLMCWSVYLLFNEPQAPVASRIMFQFWFLVSVVFMGGVAATLLRPEKIQPPRICSTEG
ncbi:MAG TPA: hypothetical protein VHP58_03125 [Alphaproteobacteria bacterium]|nr:hypothetical protein [Alphaproteobacteria bacterium]